jgi:hypothetical protein
MEPNMNAEFANFTYLRALFLFQKHDISQIQELLQELKSFKPSPSLYHVLRQAFELQSLRNQTTSESNMQQEPVQAR